MFFDRPPEGERAVLLHVREPRDSYESNVAEFEELVSSADLFPMEVMLAVRSRPNPRFYIGLGKAEELKKLTAQREAQLVIINHELTAAQERNLEDFLGLRVMSRTELILHIFASRARTFEGRLQVELAQLQHAQGRVTRGWTHLDRQKGGSTQKGGMSVRGGVGETQIELDQRMIRGQIKRVIQRLERVRKQRNQSRKRRSRARVPTVVIVGYTNAGKSTLFNALTDSRVYAKNRMFETLAPTLRRISLNGFGEVVLADTVGFIRDLPLQLVDAFKATLEEIARADLLLHVIDCSAQDILDTRQTVEDTLVDIGAGDVPRIEVYNKIDKATIFDIDEQCDYDRTSEKVYISAKSGDGFPNLLECLGAQIGVQHEPITVRIEVWAGKVRSWLYEIGAVLQETTLEDGGSSINIRIDTDGKKQLMNMDGVTLQRSEAPHKILPMSSGGHNGVESIRR